MKTDFIIHPVIASALDAAGYRTQDVRNAVKSARNDLAVKDTSQKGGDMKWNGKDDGKGKVTAKESETVTYEGAVTTPGKFGAWHDYVAAGFKKFGEPAGTFPVSAIPAILVFWLDAKFKVAATDTGKPATDAGRKPAKGSNGRGVKPEETPAPVPAPTV